MENLIILCTPILVALVTSGAKKIKKLDVLSTQGRKVILRFIVALLSFLAVIGGAMLNGIEIDAISINTFVDALVVFLGASGTYFLATKKKKEPVLE